MIRYNNCDSRKLELQLLKNQTYLKNGDLDYLKEVDPTRYIYQIFYIWAKKEYLASELYDLTEQEKKSINNQMIHEIEEEK